MDDLGFVLPSNSFGLDLAKARSWWVAVRAAKAPLRRVSAVLEDRSASFQRPHFFSYEGALLMFGGKAAAWTPPEGAAPIAFTTAARKNSGSSNGGTPEGVRPGTRASRAESAARAESVDGSAEWLRRSLLINGMSVTAEWYGLGIFRYSLFDVRRNFMSTQLSPFQRHALAQMFFGLPLLVRPCLLYTSPSPRDS